MEKDNDKKEYYARVLWKDYEDAYYKKEEFNECHTKDGYIIGTLAYFEGKYYFKYEKIGLKGARKKGFTDIASFNDDNKLYISENSLFNFFKMRVSEGFQEKPEALLELIVKGGKSLTDDFSIQGVERVHWPAVKAEIRRIEEDQKEAEEKKKAEAERER